MGFQCTAAPEALEYATHAVFGVYAEVIEGGTIAAGEPVGAPRGGRLPARGGLGLA